MTQTFDPLMLSVIVRMHEGASLCMLDEALFSLSTAHRGLPNDARLALEVVVVAQSTFDPSAIASVRALLAKHSSSLTGHCSMIVLPNPRKLDLRSMALNAGVSNSHGRYIAFLDYDDVIYPEGYARLVGQLMLSGRVLAAGGVIRAEIEPAEDGFVIRQKSPWLHLGSKQVDLLQSNFLPLHSFVIDRTRVRLPGAWFDDSLIRLEDYDFLLRLGATGAFDLSHMGTPVCEYRLRARVLSPNTTLLSGAFAHSNVNPLSNRSRDNLHAWKRARAHLSKLKLKLRRDITQCAELSADAPSGVWVGSPFSPARWIRAAAVASDQSGGLVAMALRIGSMLRSQGPKAVWQRAIGIARRVDGDPQ